jgi:hypothetical protein
MKLSGVAVVVVLIGCGNVTADPPAADGGAGAGGRATTGGGAGGGSGAAAGAAGSPTGKGGAAGASSMPPACVPPATTSELQVDPQWCNAAHTCALCTWWTAAGNVFSAPSSPCTLPALPCASDVAGGAACDVPAGTGYEAVVFTWSAGFSATPSSCEWIPTDSSQHGGSFAQACTVPSVVCIAPPVLSGQTIQPTPADCAACPTQ